MDEIGFYKVWNIYGYYWKVCLIVLVLSWKILYFFIFKILCFSVF